MQPLLLRCSNFKATCRHKEISNQEFEVTSSRQQMQAQNKIVIESWKPSKPTKSGADDKAESQNVKKKSSSESIEVNKHLYCLRPSPFGTATYAATNIHLTKPTLAKFPFNLVHWGPANLNLLSHNYKINNTPEHMTLRALTKATTVHLQLLGLYNQYFTSFSMSRWRIRRSHTYRHVIPSL